MANKYDEYRERYRGKKRPGNIDNQEFRPPRAKPPKDAVHTEPQTGQPGPRPGNATGSQGPRVTPRKPPQYPSRPGSSTDPSLFGPAKGSVAGQPGFNPFAAGDKRYGSGLRRSPNIGPTSSPEGYAERDRSVAAKRRYMTEALKKKKQGKFWSPESLRTQRPGAYKNR